MKTRLALICLIASSLVIGAIAVAQETRDGQQANASSQSIEKHKGKNRGPGKEAAKGGEDIGKGVGKGAESAGKGTAGAAADLVTLHPIDAGASLGSGAAGAGKDVGVGSAKGTAKIGKGVGSGFKKLGKKALRKSDKKKDQQ
jgi:hypothetical protein